MTTVQPKSTPKELNPDEDLDLKRKQAQEVVDRENDKNTSADYGGRSGKTNKLSGSGIDVAGPGGK